MYGNYKLRNEEERKEAEEAATEHRRVQEKTQVNSEFFYKSAENREKLVVTAERKFIEDMSSEDH